VARLRHDSGSSRPILLRTELSAGHGGASGRYHAWRDAAFELAWLIDATTPAQD
jgi:oligopeptidase B